MALDKTIKIKVDQAGASSDIDKLDSKMDRLDNTTKDANKSFGALKATVVAVAAALQVRQIAQYADAFTSIQNQIRQTTSSTKDLTDRTSDLLNIANRSRVEFSATAELYTNLALSTESLNLSTEKQLRLTETIAKSFAVSGKSAAESAGAIRQLGQAFASGALRGDEFNSIAEGAPEIMRALQRSLNKTQGELRDFAATGGITAEVLVNALSGAADVIDTKMSKATKTLAQSFQEAENNAIAFIGSSDLVTTTVGVAGDAIISLSENLDTLSNVVLVAAALGYSRLSAAIILNTVETVKNTVAKTASIPATARVNNGINFTTKAVQSQTTAMRASALAAKGLRGALALLGGPAGIAVLAASALTFFITSAETAKEKTRRLSTEVDTLAQSFQGLTKAQIEVQLRNATTEANRLEKAVLDASNKFKELDKNVGFGGGQDVANAAREVKDLTKELDAAIKKRDALFQAGLNAGRTPETGETKVKPTPTSKGKSKVTDIFINTEKTKTESLRAELNERQAIQRAFNNLLLQDFKSLADQERAIAEFNRQQELAGLARDMENSKIDFEARREQLLVNTRLTAEQKAELEIELQLQEIDQRTLFELEKTQIEEDAAAERVAITKNEFRDKFQLAQTWTQAAFALSELVGSKSEKANKKRRKREMRANGAAGIVRAWAESPFWVALGQTIAIAASTEAQIKKLDSGGGGVSAGASGAVSTAPARRDPISSQSNVVEFRGLSEIADALNNRDSDEVLPVEYTQRIVNSLEEYNRLSGG